LYHLEKKGKLLANSIDLTVDPEVGEDSTPADLRLGPYFKALPPPPYFDENFP